MSNTQISLLEWAKAQGPIFVIMAIVVYVLFNKLSETEQRYEKKIDRIEMQVQDCNKMSIELLKNQIEKNNEMMQNFVNKNGRN